MWLSATRHSNYSRRREWQTFPRRGAQIEWQPSPNVNVNIAVVRFFVSGFLKEANARDIDWVALWTTFNF
jgi:hypothetical protein